VKTNKKHDLLKDEEWDAERFQGLRIREGEGTRVEKKY